MDEEQEVLKELAARAILEFEDVKLKYKEYFEKSSKEEAKRRKVDAQFKQLKQVSLLAVAEYESLHKQYVTENKYRLEVEEKLRKVNDENKVIRKQNKLGDNTTIIPASDGDTVQGTKGELEVLRVMKDAVNNELRNTKNELSRTKEMLEQEKAARAMAERRLEIGAQQLKQLNRVSVLALDEFTDLRKKFETEADCRRKAEDVATELVVKQELTDRKTKIFEEQSNKDEQLRKMMEEIDSINQLAQEERRKNSIRIKELEEELKSLENTEAMKSMEDKLSLMMEQLDIAQKQLTECEARCQKAESDSRNLYTRLALAEREVDSSRFASLPPPPPPPPPPIAAPVIRKFISKIGRKKKEFVKEEDDPMITAMTDMIDRIKKGVKLRSVASPAKLNDSDGKEEPGAMGELAGLLSNLKRNKIGTENSVDAVEEDETKQPEFARFKLKKTNTLKSTASMEAEDERDNELKKKLAKQKSVADGIAEESSTNAPPKTAEKPKKRSESEGDLTENREINSMIVTEVESGKTEGVDEDEKTENVEEQSVPNSETQQEEVENVANENIQEAVQATFDVPVKAPDDETVPRPIPVKRPSSKKKELTAQNSIDQSQSLENPREQASADMFGYTNMDHPVPVRRPTTSQDVQKPEENLYELVGSVLSPASPAT